MNRAVLFSSAKDEWETPQAFFEILKSEFNISCDVAATFINRKCNWYFGLDHPYQQNKDGLKASWAGYGVCWCNPPYSRGLQKKFIAKAAAERLNGVTTVMLLPARTDTKAFHDHIYDVSQWAPREGVEIRFIKGRLKFGGAANGAPFPSMVVIFRGR